ncbi:MAG TPA: hypothetical protein VGK29_04595 [Paludibaculum sp.]
MQNNQSNFWSRVGERWGSFFYVVLDPWALILGVATAAFLYTSAGHSDKTISAVLSLGVTVSSGLLGGVLAHRWAENTETQVLVARGHSAIRNLRLLMGTVRTIEHRVQIYLSRLACESCSQEVVRTYLEEVLQGCVTLHEETVNAVENWTDIIPNADITTQVGKIHELQTEIDGKQSEVEKLKAELDANETSTSERVAVVEKALKEKIAELVKAKRELSSREVALGNVVFGGSLTLPPSPKIRMVDWGPFTINAKGIMETPSISVVSPSSRCKGCGGTLATGRCSSCGMVILN